jgi:hypothetical protein
VKSSAAKALCAATAASSSSNSRRAVLRCCPDGDGRRSGALFGARAGAVGRTRSTGQLERFRVLRIVAVGLRACSRWCAWNNTSRIGRS